MTYSACPLTPPALEVTQRAIAAGKAVLGREIVIQSDANFTPPGKRTSRLVRHAMTGRRAVQQIRLYVGGKAFRSLALTEDNLSLTDAWRLAQTTPGQGKSVSRALRYLGPSRDDRTNRWMVTCPACGFQFEPQTTMLVVQHLTCPARKCGVDLVANYNAGTVRVAGEGE